MKVAVAMSGGIDSSAAAILLKVAGYDIIGITMELGNHDVADARTVADKLDIPHYSLDLQDTFTEKVIDYFCREYRLGRTPNPCIRCNQYIKFGTLLEKARQMGSDLVATGHHARIRRKTANGRYLLKKGIDWRKDQSYFLYSLTQNQLSRAIFPVGNITKERTRQIARALWPPLGTRAESQEICFIPNDDHITFLKGAIAEEDRPGPILDSKGNILGTHQGIPYYTIGQRKGLGIAAQEPLYVMRIDPEQNAVIVGSKEEVYGTELFASGLNWISIDRLNESIAAKAKIRYRHEEADAIITPLNEDGCHVKFNEPQWAITPGQAVVFYNGDTVIGGGTIDSVTGNRKKMKD